MNPSYILTQFAIAAGALVCALSANAAVVTIPSGTLTGPGADALAADTWLRSNVRAGAATGITVNFPRNGDGSAYMQSSDGVGKADWEYYQTGGFGKLSEISTYSYDWYREGASTVFQHLHPVMRLIVDIDGDTKTTPFDIGYLVFERCYNDEGCLSAPTNQWVSQTITGTTNLWFSQVNKGVEEVYNRTLSDYQAGTYTPTEGWKQVTGNSVVIGISMGIGSGWSGTFKGAVDTPTLGTFASNFEVKAPVAAAPVAVPALDLVGLLALSGAVGVAASAIARRRRTARSSPL